MWYSQIKQLFSLKVVLYSLFSVIGILNNPQFIKHKISWLTFIKFRGTFLKVAAARLDRRSSAA